MLLVHELAYLQAGVATAGSPPGTRPPELYRQSSAREFNVDGLLGASTARGQREKRLRAFWAAGPSHTQQLVYQNPSFEPHGREWSEPFDMAHGNKGELTSARCAFSVSVRRRVEEKR